MRCTLMIRPQRRGIASLELVLVFPLLLAIVSVLFAIGQCDVAKVGTATDARRQTWAQRPKADPGSPLSLFQDPMVSKIDPLQQHSVSLGPVFSGRTQQAQSKNTLIANPWAFTAIKFSPLNQNNTVPHTTELSYVPVLGSALAALCSGMGYALPSGVPLTTLSYVILPTNYALVAAGGVLIASVFATYPGVSLWDAAQGLPGF